MARVPYLTPDDADDSNRDVLARGINLYFALGNVPGAARAFSTLGLWLRFESKLDTRLRELAILTVGRIERAAYEWAHHVELGFQFGVTEADLSRLIAEVDDGRETDLEPLARLVIRGAAEMALDGEMGSKTWDALSEHLDHKLMIELVAAVAFYCGLCRVLKTLRIDVEPEAQAFLDKWPLPKS